MSLPHNKTILARVNGESQHSQHHDGPRQRSEPTQPEPQRPDQKLTREFVHQRIKPTEITLLAQKQRRKLTKIEKC